MTPIQRRIVVFLVGTMRASGYRAELVYAPRSPRDGARVKFQMRPGMVDRRGRERWPVEGIFEEWAVTADGFVLPVSMCAYAPDREWTADLRLLRRLSKDLEPRPVARRRSS